MSHSTRGDASARSGKSHKTTKDTQPLLSRKERQPGEIVSLSWTDLEVVTLKGRTLLNKVSGVARPGELIALMGASGAGKSTLLNTLLGRNLKGLKVTGEIRVNGQSVGRDVTTVSGYVQQEDLFMGNLTVLEHLRTQAACRLPASFTAAQRDQRIKQVMDDMMLNAIAKNRIGIPGIRKGISGGEMKRLAFATEMLSDPPILFCDEPTTGLDSHMAMIVIKRLEKMAAEQGKTIICTIHQPSSDLFEIFDKVMFLSQGGVAFLGSPAEAVHFFASMKCYIPPHTNPADHYINVLAVVPGEEEACIKRGKEVCAHFNKSEYKTRMMRQIEKAREPKALRPRENASYPRIAFNLLYRYTIDNVRNPAILRAKFVQKIFMGLFLGFLYYQTELDQDGVTSMKGALFYYLAELSYSTVYGIQACMPGDFSILAREYHDGIYPVSAYYIAKVSSYILIFMLDGMVMVAISFFLIGFAGQFTLTLLTCVLVESCAAALGIMVSACAPSYAIAVSITGPLLTVFSLTGGLFTNVAELSPYVAWVQYLSWFRYGYETLVINEFTSEGKTDLPCHNAFNETVSYCFKEGEQVIRSLAFEDTNVPFNLIMMVIYIFALYFIGYIGLVARVVLAR